MRLSTIVSHEQILSKVESLKSTPIAIQALWDGDSTGWFVCFAAITADLQTHPLGIVSDGRDIRLFNGQVPPWPEAVAAKQLGNELAERFGAEFYFPSPDHPEDDCPSWTERSQGYPCRRCGILLLQLDPCPWRGICYHCHLDEERELREARWTPEQRAGSRCHICGNPATKELNGGPSCAECFDKYEVYNCERCNGVTMILKCLGHTSLCSRCELQGSIESLSDSQKHTIRKAMETGRLNGIQSAMDVMGCSLHEADYVVHVLRESTSPKNTA
jgi:hypothetical protein